MKKVKEWGIEMQKKKKEKEKKEKKKVLSSWVYKWPYDAPLEIIGMIDVYTHLV